MQKLKVKNVSVNKMINLSFLQLGRKKKQLHLKIFGCGGHLELDWLQNVIGYIHPIIT